ncbi:MAG: SUMF1/EgtB/PvdO family nonheme iron enzyme [Nitrospira sp.]|nr:SUMF1/EgtB/PvdO family nonheme iron enzyme [Nitrospira sp.]
MGEQYLSYDAFISYSRQDKVFAALLEKALESYKPPRGLGIPRRYLRIFRDESDFTGVEYQTSLDKHLKASSKLIVVCSPAARQSPYVDDEIRRFVLVRGPEHVVPVLLRGIPNNEVKTERESEQAFPSALCEALRMPLSADYRGFDPRSDKVKSRNFEGSWHKVLADLCGKSRDQIEQREKKRLIRQRNLTLLLGGFVIFLILWPVWLLRNGYTIDQALLKIQSLVMDIHEPPRMVQLSGGTFQQGDTHGGGQKDESPVREVTVKSFAMGKFEVTFDEYDRFALATGRLLPGDQGWGRGQRPVIMVSWEDAKAYAGWLSEQAGKHYRLPTESEWEYAARSEGKDDLWAGTSNAEELKEYAVYAVHSGNRTALVGYDQGRKPNSIGLYDMSGNVLEWVEDCVHDNYEQAPTNGTAWLEEARGDCQDRMNRGGAWGANRQATLRVSRRFSNFAGTRNDGLGFRLAQDIEK